MRSAGTFVLGCALAATLGGCGRGASGVAPIAPLDQPATSERVGGEASAMHFGAVRGDAAQACAAVGENSARCHAWVRLDLPLLRAGADPNTIVGYHPSDLRSAYRLPSEADGAGQTVAVVDAYDDSHAESDLAVYRKQWGMPPCTTANGCFQKVNEFGKPSPLPSPDTTGWSLEESVDVDMVSAACPKCRIILVEGRSNSFKSLALSVDAAAALGANAISNSYGGGELRGNLFDSHYDHPGVMVTASDGDSGYGTQFPAASRFVTAVGGTTLVKSTNKRGWAETVWSGTGSGCSIIETKPAWQTDTGCSRRTIGDTAAVSDPGDGVAIYDTYPRGGGWAVAGGTSVASPLIAATYALAGNEASLTFASLLYSAPKGSLYDITRGSNGHCKIPYLCNGEKGYDGPTGNGTPDGIEAF